MWLLNMICDGSRILSNLTINYIFQKFHQCTVTLNFTGRFIIISDTKLPFLILANNIG